MSIDKLEPNNISDDEEIGNLNCGEKFKVSNVQLPKADFKSPMQWKKVARKRKPVINSEEVESFEENRWGFCLT